jgi:tetratricopeptide (TPR) repeat protein
MPLNMELYTEYNKKKTYTSLAVLVLVFVFLLFCDFSSYAQVNKANPQSNTGKELEELLQKAAANIGISPALAEQLADKAFTLAQEKKEALYTIRALILSGKIKNLKGDHTAALNLYSKAATLARQQHAVKEEIETFINIGEMVYKKGDYDQSLLLFLKADSLAGSSHLERQQATALYSLVSIIKPKVIFRKPGIIISARLQLTVRITTACSWHYFCQAWENIISAKEV